MTAMKGIYVGSTCGFSGKTSICLGLALKAMEVGFKVGYFKPIGWKTMRGSRGEPLDEDAVLMKETLGLKESFEAICPIVTHPRFLDEVVKVPLGRFLKKVKTAYREVSRGKSFMIVEGMYNVCSGGIFNIPTPRLTRALNLKILLVAKPENDMVVDEILYGCSYASILRAKMLGILFNNVPPQMAERIKSTIEPYLKKHGVRTLGAIVENTELSAPTVREIFDATGGSVLAGEKNMDRLVQNVLVGAMQMQDALRYLRKSVNKVLVTGGDRTDLISTALETSMSALVLTGNIYPHLSVISKAEELGVPIILVPHDTYTTVKLVEKVTGKIKPYDKRRIELTKKLIEENVDWKNILDVK